MDCQKIIKCTAENAAEMQKVVKALPELHALVKDLQAHKLFPGLRGLQITITGTQEVVAKGLAGIYNPDGK